VAIPDFQTMMRPLLLVLEDGQERTSTQIREALASEFSLTQEELAEMIPSGRAKTFANRVAWAMTHMYQARLLDRPRRSVYRITPRGIEVLAAEPKRVDLKILAQFDEYRAFRTKGGATSDAESAAGTEFEVISSDHTPEEQISAAYRSIRSALVADLLERVADKPSQFFERLVLDVLRAMGYGGVGADSTTHLGQSGDEGVDGVIREDKLGLDLIYVQAKRWSNPVGRPEIQKFFGALHGKRASKGVFITTSFFTSEAASYADGVTPRIILIDGHQLARLMVDYGVGVSTVETYELKRVNLDYFADEDEATAGPPAPPTLS
jgi:restriction system protein